MRDAGRPMHVMRRVATASASVATAVWGYVLVARGALTLDLGIGRRVRPLRTIRVSIAASSETVFDVVAAPYLNKTPRAMRNKLEVLERGSDMVLAAHYTQLRGFVTVTTVETVRFERPERITFRLVRGPVPHLAETFELHETAEGTELAYTGEIGTDLWLLGVWWGEQVSGPWERTVEESLIGVKAEAERRGRARQTAAATPRDGAG